MLLYILVVLLAVVGGSTSAIFARIATAPSMVLVVYRMLLSTLFLLPSAFIKRNEYRKMPKKALLLAVCGGLILGLHFSLYFQAVKTTSIAAAAVLCNTQVVFVALFSVLLFHQKYSVKVYLSIAAALFGACLMAAAGSGSSGSSLSGDACAMGASLALAGYMLISSVCRESMDTLLYTSITYPCAAAIALILTLLSGTPVIGYEPINLLAALGMAVFCTMMGHSLLSWSLKFLSPAVVSTMELLDSFFCMLWGILLFQEVPGPVVILGALISVGGVLAFCRLENESKEDTAEKTP